MSEGAKSPSDAKSTSSSSSEKSQPKSGDAVTMAMLKQLQDNMVSLINNKFDELSQRQHDEKKKRTSKRSKQLESSDESDSSDQSDQDYSKSRKSKKLYRKGRAHKYAMIKPLDIDMITWPTWIRNVERLFGLCGCHPEDVEKIKDPIDKLIADRELMTILEIQTGPAFKKSIERLLDCDEEYPGLFLWHDLSSQADLRPGTINMWHIKCLIQCLYKAISRPIHTLTPRERIQLNRDLNSAAASMKAQQLTVEDIIVLTTYNIYEGHLGVNSFTKFNEMKESKHYSYKDLATLRTDSSLIEGNIQRYAKHYNFAASSANHNDTDDLQAHVFRPKHFKPRPSRSNHPSQSHRSGGERHPQTSKEPCFRCGLFNHSADDCNYTNRKCWICNESGHKNTKCPQQNNSLHKESREHTKKRKRYQAKNRNKVLNHTSAYDSDDESCISVNLAGA